MQFDHPAAYGLIAFLLPFGFAALYYALFADGPIAEISSTSEVIALLISILTIGVAVVILARRQV